MLNLLQDWKSLPECDTERLKQEAEKSVEAALEYIGPFSVMSVHQSLAALVLEMWHERANNKQR